MKCSMSTDRQSRFRQNEEIMDFVWIKCLNILLKCLTRCACYMCTAVLHFHRGILYCIER